jgi:hypothetical protein
MTRRQVGPTAFYRRNRSLVSLTDALVRYLVETDPDPNPPDEEYKAAKRLLELLGERLRRGLEKAEADEAADRAAKELRQHKRYYKTITGGKKDDATS